MESMVKRMSLMRLVGCLLIVTASVGFGMQLKKELADHLELLYELRRLFVAISYAEIYAMQPMEQLLGQSLSTHPALQKALDEIKRALSEKNVAGGRLIWQETFGAAQKELRLTEEELAIVVDAGRTFFGNSIEENKRQLALCLERLDFVIEQSRAGQKEKQKVYQTLSVVCGFMLILLLL